MEELVLIILLLITGYLCAGFLVTVFLLVKGLGRVDEMAKGSTTGFKLIIIPGMLVFWPVLLKKWISAK